MSTPPDEQFDYIDTDDAIAAGKLLLDGLSSIADLTCSYIYIKNAQAKYVYVNSLYQNLLGVSSRSKILGKSDSELLPLERAKLALSSDNRVLQFHERIEVEEAVIFEDDVQPRIFWTVKMPIKNTEGAVVGLAGISTDISKAKLKNSFEEIKNVALEQIASGYSLNNIFLTLTRGIESLTTSSRCSILLVDRETRCLSLGECSSLPDFFNDAVDGLSVGVGVGSCGTAAAIAKRVIVDDVETHEYWKPFLALTRQAKIGACWSEPIVSSSGEVLGTFALYYASKYSPQEYHIQMMEQFAHLASIAIERSNSARALHQQESYQRALLDNLPFLIWFKDKSDRYLTVNKKFADACGIENAQELLGKTAREIWPDLLATQHQRDDAIVLESGQHTILEEEVTLQGQRLWYETYKSPIFLDDKIVGIVGFARDITARKNNEMALRESKALLSSVIENVPMRIFWKDKDLNYLGCNSIFAKDAGYDSPASVIGKSDYSLSWAAQADLYRDDDAKVINTGTPKYNFEEPQSTPNGQMLWLRTSKMPLKDETGNVLGILGLYEDITKQKVAESELRVAATAFQSQEGIMITDASSNIIKVNQAFTEITGYTQDDVLGKKPSILSSGHHPQEFYEVMWQEIREKGSWEGEIWNKRQNGDIYPEHLIITAVYNLDGQITNYVATLTDVSQTKQAAKEIQHLAYYDTLTGLPNRRLLQDRLSHILTTIARTGHRAALLFIDLDHFKMLNDTYGHDNGDILLKLVAERLKLSVRENDTVARLGGDEFVVLLENLGETDLEAATLAETVASKIVATLNQPYRIGVNEHISTPSIGIVVIDKQHNSTNELLKQADIAMYQAKKAGRNTVRFFSPQMQASINARVSLERELRLALEKRQLTLYYQAQVDSAGKPFGAEVLIRWIHPEKGIISPAQFIPLAEETGLIIPIGLWVLDVACAQLKSWQSQPLTQHLSLSVNISARQIRQTEFVYQLTSMIKRYGVNPVYLKLELTESSLLENIDETISCMNALGELGVNFSLDDFGTGYSSLQYLKRLPLYQLKIDKSFVRDIVTDSSDKAIVSTIIAMANSLKLRAIAEGVETKEQQKLLMEEGCNEFQGYYFGVPQPIEVFENLLVK